MPTVKTITFSYRPKEDRLLAGINLGQPDVWACWLTRRLSLAVVAGWKKFLADTSRLAQQTASDHRQELAEFEREAGLAATAKSISPTPAQAVMAISNTAELAERLTISQQGEHFRLELAGDRGGMAAAVIQRAELQRILRMLEEEISKASWVAPAATPQVLPQEGAPKPARH
jgi:hypothetical protein